MTLVVPYDQLDDRAGLVQVWGQLGTGGIYSVVQLVVSFGAIAALLASMFGSMFPMPRYRTHAITGRSRI